LNDFAVTDLPAPHFGVHVLVLRELSIDLFSFDNHTTVVSDMLTQISVPGLCEADRGHQWVFGSFR
jgi:hypothetical protein